MGLEFLEISLVKRYILILKLPYYQYDNRKRKRN